MENRIFLGLLFFAATVVNLFGQAEKSGDLFKVLQVEDSLFFERGFNQCDLEYLKNHISEDLKFYHDKSGFQDKRAFFENTQKNICSSPERKPIRKVDVKSLQVFPLYDQGKLYGAIQQGNHNFYLRESGREDVLTRRAKFTHVWILEQGNWKLTEVLSYDHREPAPEEERKNEIEQLLEDNRVPALGIGIIEDGQLTKVEVYGTLDKTTTAPYNTIFKVASLTKPIVALTSLKLIDKGMLGLNEPLYKYWVDPDIEKDKRHKLLTPKLVLTHQTGFANWRYLEEANELAFQFHPGTGYNYSGEGFEYLRKAIEKKFGKSIEILAEELVFSPAGMSDTRFWWDTAMEENRYAQNHDKERVKIPTVKYCEANAAANLLTTVEDYGRFLTYVINGAELSDTLFQEMLSPQVRLKENDYFGLGWEILTGFRDDEYALLHTGRDPGVSTLAVIFPKSENGYLIFMNGDNVNNIYEHLLNKRLYLGEELWSKR